MLTETEYDLLSKAVLIEAVPEAQPHPEQEEAIKALMALTGERLRLVVAWAVSDELIPEYEEMGHEFIPFFEAVMQLESFTARECLELILAISKSTNGDDDLAHLLYAENVCSAITRKLPVLPHDAFVLFRNFLHGFPSQSEGEDGKKIAIDTYWAFSIAKLFDWGLLSCFIEEISEEALDQSKNQLKAWDSLIMGRMAYIDHQL